VNVFDHRDVQGILGKEVRSATDESMGRIVDIIRAWTKLVLN
jgi:hypothetical protein